jgi:hypothetical protein
VRAHRGRNVEAGHGCQHEVSSCRSAIGSPVCVLTEDGMWRPGMVVSMRSVARLSVRYLLQCCGSRLVESGLGSSSQIHTQ